MFYFAFAKEVMAITDDVLDPLDELLNDPPLIDLAAQALAKRRVRGREQHGQDVGSLFDHPAA